MSAAPAQATAIHAVVPPSLMEKTAQRELEAQEIDSRKREAIWHLDMIKSAASQSSRSSLRIGWHAYRLKQKGLWGMLGCRDENEARELADVSESTWYANIRLAEMFPTLDQELFINMKQANAKALSDMPDSARTDRQWIKWASEESIKVFAARVNEAMNGKARASDSAEPTRTMKISMPASRQKSIDEGLKVYAEKAGLDPADQGKVIEMAVAEVNSGETLVGAIVAGIQMLAKIKEFIESDLSSDEILSRVVVINEDLILHFNNALQTSGHLPNV